MDIDSCGNLAPSLVSSTIDMRNNQLAVEVGNAAQPFTLPLRPDGKLVGPGALTISGQVLAGYDTYTVTPAPTVSNPFPIGWTSTFPTYKPATARCSFSLLTPETSISDTGNFFGLLDSAPAKTVTAGFRLSGTYFGSGGFSIEFQRDAAVLNCGQSADTQEYTVQNTGAQTNITIKNGNTPVSLVYKSDGTLGGSGPLQVNGRRLIGQNGDGSLAFAPRPATCTLSVLTGNKSSPSTVAAVNQPPPPPAPTKSAAPLGSANPSSGNAVLSLSSGFQSQSGMANPLAGHTMVLLRDSLENTLSKGGFKVSPGTNAFKAMIQECAKAAPDCQTAVNAMNSGTVAGAKIAPTGQTTFSGVAPGSYYLMGSASSGGHVLLWDFNVNLKPGTNSVALSQSNATPLN
jgi:hypothetical protein